jgi:hypothetical protein
VAQPAVPADRFAREIGGILARCDSALAAAERQTVGPSAINVHLNEGAHRMLEMMNASPALAGTTCESFICQQYWYAGTLAADVHVLYLKIIDGPWYRFFFDYGVFFCKQVDAPDVWQTSPHDEHHYPQIDIASRYDLNGRTIVDVQLLDRDSLPTLVIRFSRLFTVLVIDEGQQMRLSIGDT